MTWMATTGPRATHDVPLLPARTGIDHLRERFYDPADDVLPDRISTPDPDDAPPVSLAELMAQGGPQLATLRERLDDGADLPAPGRVARRALRRARAVAAPAGRDLRAAAPRGRPRVAGRGVRRVVRGRPPRREPAHLRRASYAAARPRPRPTRARPAHERRDPPETEPSSTRGRATRLSTTSSSTRLGLAVRGRRGRPGVRPAPRAGDVAQAALHQRPHAPARLARAGRARAGAPVAAQRPLPRPAGRPRPRGRVEAPGDLRDRQPLPDAALRRRVVARGDARAGPPPRPAAGRGTRAATHASSSTGRTSSTTSRASGPRTPPTRPATRSGRATRSRAS